MSRRRRPRGQPTVKAAPYADALPELFTMERAVAYRTVTCEFEVADVLRWLWPPSTVDLLSAAKLLSKESISGSNFDFPLTLPGGTTCRFHFHLDKIGMFPPLRDPWPNFDHPLHEKIIAAIDGVEHTYKQHNKVRQVIDWLDNNATPGAARFYFPALCALLHREHPINQAQGERYREVVVPYHIAELMRECQSIVAAGLMSDPNRVVVEHELWGVQIIEGTNVSQRFMLK